MPEAVAAGCARPTGGPVGEAPDGKTIREQTITKERQFMIQAFD